MILLSIHWPSTKQISAKSLGIIYHPPIQICLILKYIGSRAKRTYSPIIKSMNTFAGNLFFDVWHNLPFKKEDALCCFLEYPNTRLVDDVNEAYDTFLNVFLKKYDKHCPIIKINTQKVNSKKPWFTNGLRNACHKKNNLYRQFLEKRSHITEQSYKMYKNKLTKILRNAEKM